MKALTVGGAMIDTIAIIANDRIERVRMTNADNSFLLLEEGRKTEALEISTHVGGGAVNAALVAHRIVRVDFPEEAGNRPAGLWTGVEHRLAVRRLASRQKHCVASPSRQRARFTLGRAHCGPAEPFDSTVRRRRRG